MLTDIEIAQQATLEPIAQIAQKLGIREEELEPYGRYKAKLSDELYDRLKEKPDGKLILVTAINPTPAGEGKTTITTGLGQAMAKIGKNAIIALREPSLGPVFGIKGGAAGGGYAQVLPMGISTCTLRATCMPLPLRITSCVLCSITICSRGIRWELTSVASLSSAVLI